MAATRTTKGPAKSRKRRSPVPRSRRRLRLLWVVALVGAAVYLYYRPLASYLETRGELSARQAEVETLRIVKAGLEQRLANSTSLEATRREARRIGWVSPGEQLYVVKGIPDWRRARSSGRSQEASKP